MFNFLKSFKKDKKSSIVNELLSGSLKNLKDGGVLTLKHNPKIRSIKLDPQYGPVVETAISYESLHEILRDEAENNVESDIRYFEAFFFNKSKVPSNVHETPKDDSLITLGYLEDSN